MPDLSPRIIPPGVADARACAFLEVLERAQAEFDPKRLLVRRVREVASDVLPALIVEFGAGEFLTPGLREDVVRDVLANIWELKAKKGTDAGVLFGLSLLGMRARWTQWWEASPPGATNTYRCRVFVEEPVIEGDVSPISAAAQDAALNMIDAMKRWSQEGTFGLGIERRGAVHVHARRRIVARKFVSAGRPTAMRMSGVAGAGALARAARVLRFATERAPLAAAVPLAAGALARSSRHLRIA